MSKEPSTEKSKNSITEATQRVVTNTKKDFVQQRKTRVSELSVIDVNEPIPTKRIHTPLDYEIMENKNLTSKIQKTRTHCGQVEKKVVRDRRQQDSYPKVGKKLRRNGRIDDQTNPRWSWTVNLLWGDRSCAFSADSRGKVAIGFIWDYTGTGFVEHCPLLKRV